MAPAFKFADRVVVPEHVLAQDLPAGEMAFVNLDSEIYFGLEATGARFWKALVESDSIEAAYRTLTGEFEIEPERLRADLEALVEQLVEKGLLEIH